MSELRAGTIFTVDGISFVPIERVRIQAETHPSAYWLNATKEAVAVVIFGPEGPQAVDMEAHKRPMDELVAEVPGLQSLISELLPQR